MTYQEQHSDLANKVIASLCNVSEYPEDLFPHTVFVEEENDEGKPAYNEYWLLSINQSDTTCILENPNTHSREEYNLSAVNTEWLITIWGWCRDLMVGDNTLRNHAIKCLQGQSYTNQERIIYFVEKLWQNDQPDEENVANFKTLSYV